MITNTVERQKFSDFYNDFIFNTKDESMEIDSYFDFVKWNQLLDSKDLQHLERIIKTVESRVDYELRTYDKKLLTYIQKAN